MKDKLVKRNLKGFDYRIRKIGIISTFVMLSSVAIILPLQQKLTQQNKNMLAEIAEVAKTEKETNMLDLEISKQIISEGRLLF